jgi:ribonuclease G
MDFLAKLWHSIKERCHQAIHIGLMHDDLPLALRALRDLVGPEVERVRIDSRGMLDRAIAFATKYIPDILTRIEYYQAERPLFDLYGVEDEIQKALQRKVQLKSGGHLVIDQTEAMTTIDVNTGAFKTNLEAAQAICRQLRLRNLGGMIIIDFIDMTEDEHKRQVLRALEKCLAKDHAKTQISEVSSLGLVEMTRKRTRESLEHVLCEPCPCCGGRGTLKTAETTCYEIFREIMQEARQFEVETLLVLASQEVVDRLLDEESGHLAELEELIGKPIRLQAEALYTQEQYDVVLI